MGKKTGFDSKPKNLNKKVTSNKATHLLVENEIKNSKHLIQVVLLFEVTLIMMEHNFSNENFMPPFTSDKSLSPKLVWYNSRIRLELK